MNQVFWIGVYPGLTPEMLAYVLEVFHQLPPRPRATSHERNQVHAMTNPLATDLDHILAHTQGLWQDLRANACPLRRDRLHRLLAAGKLPLGQR